jgi:DNA-nicking Smr family endonuclease
VEKKPNTKISKEDLDTWNNFINQTKSVEDKDVQFSSKHEQKNVASYELRVDLHGYTIAEAFEKIDHLILFAQEKKIKKILLITGKGLHSNKESDPYVSKDLSLLRYAVPEYLKKNYSSSINTIESSPISLGGEGSMIVTLKKL